MGLAPGEILSLRTFQGRPAGQAETAFSCSSLHRTDQPVALGTRLRSTSWRADWPDREGYDVGPPSIAWLSWHIGFWWSMVLDHTFAGGTLGREQVAWPGSATAVREWIARLHRQWRSALEHTSDAELESTQRTRWPFQNRPFGDLAAWVNIELTKNAAEIGYARFLYAVRAT